MDFATDFVTDFLSCVFLRRKTDFATEFENLRALPMTEKGEKYVEVKIHSKIHDENPRRAPGETCCLHSRGMIFVMIFGAWR